MSVLRQDTAALQDGQAQLIRVCEVVSTDPSTATVRVKIHDADGLISYDLPVVQHKTHKDQHYWMPDVGEHVVCHFLSHGLEQGFVSGAIYSQGDTPPANSQDVDHKVYKDGTYHEYDRKAHKQHGHIKGKFEYEIDETFDLHIKDDVEITADKDVKITIKGSANIVIEQDCDLTVEGNASTTIQQDCDLTVNGQRTEHVMGNVMMRSEGTITMSAGKHIYLICDRDGRFII